MREIWKDIEGYEGLYQISNLGRVKSLSKFRNTGTGGYWSKEKILITSFNRYGYETISLIDNYKISTRKVHRLVAEAFIANPNNYKEINHKDGYKRNNCIDNLEWSTRSKNIIHAHKLGLRNHKGIKHPKAILTEKDVLDIREMCGKISQVNIAKIYNVSTTCISDIIHRKNWKHI